MESEIPGAPWRLFGGRPGRRRGDLVRERDVREL